MKSFVFYLLFIPFITLSQTIKNDLINIIKNKQIIEKSEFENKHSLEYFTIDRIAEDKTIFLGTVKLYQTLVSSQDNSVCNFTPSCSRFSSSAIRQTGFLKGLLLTSDRLQRCNGSAYHDLLYKFDLKSQKFSDPIDIYIK